MSTLGCVRHFIDSVRKQEAQLPQRDRATSRVSKFVQCFTSCGNYKDFKQQKWPSRSFKCIDNGAIQQTTYDSLFPLQLCFYLAPFSRYYHLFHKIYRGHVTLSTSVLGVILYHACTRTSVCV